MKDSLLLEDNLWVDVPAYWPLTSLKHLCLASALYGANVSADSYLQEGVRFIRTSDIKDDGSLQDIGVYLPKDLLEGYLLNDGDLLISRSGTVGKAFLYSSKDGECAYAGYLVRFVFDKKQCPKYYFYLTKSPPFQLWLSMSAIEATIGNVNGEKYANFIVPNPPLSEQCAIADYLDRETAHIDLLIAAKQRLLELLAEKRRAIITHTITRGLHPDVSLRDSGVEWLGKIPNHWHTEYSRWLFREIDERSVNGEEELLSVSHLTGVTSRSEKDVNMFMAESNEGYKVCRPGDLVINTLWAWMGAMGVSLLHGIVSPAYNVYRPSDQLEPSYIDYLVRMPVFATEVTRYSKGVWSSRLRLYPEGFFEVKFPVPPRKEQQAIVDYLMEQTQKIDRLAELARDTIKFLHERRTALIAAAVSGRIEVIG